MAQYRKKPVVIEARQLDGTLAVADYICEWVGPSAFKAQWNEGRGTCDVVTIRTLEGNMRADVGDWIIREPFPTDDRQFYPCKPDIFAATYEALDTPRERSLPAPLVEWGPLGSCARCGHDDLPVRSGLCWQCADDTGKL